MLVLAAALSVGVKAGFAASTTTTELQDFQNEGTLDVTPSSVAPGGTLHVSGSGCILDGSPAEHVALIWGRLAYEDGPHQRFAQAPVKPDGSWSLDFVVPRDAPPEPYVLGTGCVGGDQMFNGHQKQVSVSTHVTAEAPTAGPPPSSRAIAAPPHSASTSTTDVTLERIASETARREAPSEDTNWLLPMFSAAGLMIAAGAALFRRRRSALPEQ